MGTYPIIVTATWNADGAAAGETGSIELTRAKTHSDLIGEIHAHIHKR